MTRVFRRYFWAINLVTLGTCAFLGARATAAYLGGKLAAPAPVVTERHGSAFVPQPLPSRTDDGIAARNLFCSTCQPAPAATPRLESPSGEPVRSTLPLRLVATLVSGETDWSFAAVLDSESGRSRLVPVGGRLAEHAKVTAIGERRVLLLSDGRLEYLDLETESVGKKPEEPRRELARSELATGIRNLGSGKYEIRREALNQVLSNTTLLAASAQIMPAVQDGKPAGFMLRRIRPGSFYQLLGMRDGDIVQAVNGRPIRTPEDALQVYTGIKNASHVTISISRGGKSSTFDYSINSLGSAQAQL